MTFHSISNFRLGSQESQNLHSLRSFTCAAVLDIDSHSFSVEQQLWLNFGKDGNPPKKRTGHAPPLFFWSHWNWFMPQSHGFSAESVAAHFLTNSPFESVFMYDFSSRILALWTQANFIFESCFSLCSHCVSFPFWTDSKPTFASCKTRTKAFCLNLLYDL